LVFALFFLPASVAAQPDAADPNLKLWLKADALVLNNGDAVTLWTDSSNNGTTFAPPDESPMFPPGLLAPHWVEEHIPGNPNPVPAVRFDAWRTRDQLLQTSNLGAGDPLDIGDGRGLTIIVVHKSTVRRPNQTMLAKRGAGGTSSVYQLGIHGNDDPPGQPLPLPPLTADVGKLNYVTFDATVEYLSGSQMGGPDKWHVTMLTIEEAGAMDTLQFYDTFAESPTQTIDPLGGALSIVDRNATTAEVFSLGGLFDGGEPYSGSIAEIIIFDEVIAGAELTALTSYINGKYFGTEAPPPPGSPVADDPTLRLWMRGEDLSEAPGQQISQWVDASSYGTTLEPREIADDSPTVQTESFPTGDLPTVRFEQTISPSQSKQLYQTNNLFNPDIDPADPDNPSPDPANIEDRGGADPLDIGDGTSLTIIAVHKPEQYWPNGLGTQTIVGKRSNHHSVYTLHIHGNQDPCFGRLGYLARSHQQEIYCAGEYFGFYDENTGDFEGENEWHISMLRITEEGVIDPLEFFDSRESAGFHDLQLTPGGVFSQPAGVRNASPTAGVDPRNRLSPFPFGIAGHAQNTGNDDKPGDKEGYRGSMAEIIIYSRALSTAEVDGLVTYLASKYIPPEGACILPGGAGGGACEILMEAECDSQGGTYQGNDTPCPGGAQLAADCNQDGARDLSDVVCLLGHLFQGNPEELPCGTTAANLLLLDCNGDGGIDLSDAIYKLAFLFQGGPPPGQGEACVTIDDCPQGPDC
jgi:hypothetical protein